MSREPITIWVAIGGILTTGVSLASIYLKLPPETQAAVIAFGNAVILTCSVIFARAQSTPTAAPVLPSGTAVTTPEGQPASVVRMYTER